MKEQVLDPVEEHRVFSKESSVINLSSDETKAYDCLFFGDYARADEYLKRNPSMKKALEEK